MRGRIETSDASEYTFVTSVSTRKACGSHGKLTHPTTTSTPATRIAAVAIKAAAAPSRAAAAATAAAATAAAKAKESIR